MQANHKVEPNGFALAAAILAMVVIGAIVTGGFYAASQESLISRSSDHGADALRIAEQGLHETIGAVPRVTLQNLATNGTMSHDGEVALDARRGGSYSVQIRRLGASDAYFMISTGTIQRGTQTYSRRTGMLVRTRNMAFTPRASLTVHGPLNVSGNADIDGADLPPGTWTGCPAGSDLPGIMARDSSTIFRFGNAHEIAGEPPIDEDPSLTEDDFFDYGDFDWSDLIAIASKTYGGPLNIVTGAAPATDAAGNCAYNVMNNWGSPINQSHVCWDFFPIIYAAGNLTLEGNSRGQGILLVEGNLVVRGGSVFYGIIIVRGSLITEGNGNHLNGVTMVFGGGALDDSFAAGNSTVQYSTCAATRAEQYSPQFMFAQPVAYRSWTDLTSAGIGN